MVYLSRGNYYGIDPEEWAVAEGVAHEISEGLVRLKRPSFRYADDFGAAAFGVTFDFALASGIFMHASPNQVGQCLRGVQETLAPQGLFIGAFIEAETDETFDTWVYPQIQRYSAATMRGLAAEAGLRLQLTDWPHTFGHRWFVATHPAHDNPVQGRLDLTVFDLTQYLRDEIERHGGRPAQHDEYLKADLSRLLPVEQRRGVLPQAFL